jgi:hypothetical protein
MITSRFKKAASAKEFVIPAKAGIQRRASARQESDCETELAIIDSLRNEYMSRCSHKELCGD